MIRTYKKHFQADGSFIFMEYRDGLAFRQVDAEHQGLIAWLEGGNTPEEVPYAAPDLEVLKAALKARIEAKRDLVVAAGITVTFPDGQAVVQTRDERDIRNAQGVAAQGLAMQVNNQTGTLVYRDAANVNHTMTPAEAIQFGFQVAQGIQDVYTASWAKKAEVDALGTVGAAQAYDIETGWLG